MSNYNQPQVVYPPPGKAEQQGGYMVAPPPAAYPTKDGHDQVSPPNTQSRGDGFWRGCCAGLCCCCLLDACF
ncbi:hypothetical protein ACS0TY_017680 [Phlomoides rotata]